MATSPTVSSAPAPVVRRGIAAIWSALRFSTPVRTRAFAPVTSPAGAASTSSAMAAAISAMLTSLAIRLTLGASTTICVAAMPRMVVRVTPSANSRIVNSSAKLASWSMPTGPVITTSVTRSRQPPRRITGSSASSGRLVTASTAVSTSASARAMSQFGSNSRLMRARPSLASAVVPTTPSTTSRAGSSSCTMAASMSSAPAPSQRTVTLIWSDTTSGKNWVRICGIAATPAASSRISSRFAAVRCRVK